MTRLWNMASSWKHALLYLAILVALTKCIFARHPTNYADQAGENDLDPYTEEPIIMTTDVQDVTEPDSCYLTVNNDSANNFQGALELYHPNFAHVYMFFNMSDGSKPNATTDAILPFQWVWTYYSPNGFFPYLKWPVDFPILSFGLLDVKTLPAKQGSRFYLHAEGKCSLTLGTRNTTKLIAFALRDITQAFLLNVDQTAFSYTYWCFLQEVPGVKDTLGYFFGIQFGFPVEFVRYRCCRTDVPKYRRTKMYVACLNRQIPKMFQCTTIPYIIGILGFAFSPALLFSLSKSIVASGKHKSSSYRELMANEEDKATDEADDAEDADHDNWLYVNGSSPINFTIIVAGLCGLVDRYPVTVSRLRRVIFVIFGPSVLYIEVYVYHKYQLDTTMALLDHGLPMGYLSMVGGYARSKANFAPFLGGPFTLLSLFYVAGVLFLVLPKDMDCVIQTGCERNSNKGTMSPLFYNEGVIEKYSGISLRRKYGYAKAAAICKAGLYMLINHSFWGNAFKIQFLRLKLAYDFCKTARIHAIFIAFGMAMLPIYLTACVLELVACICYYGIPIFTAIVIASKGYIATTMKLFNYTQKGSSQTPLTTLQPSNRKTLSRTIIQTLKYILATIVTCLFICFGFSFCTIFTESFSFMAKLLVFSLMSVIIYPSFAFGYFFFGVILIFYIFKLFKSFGEGYSELLLDTLEASLQIHGDFAQARVFNGTVYITSTSGSDIKSLQVHNRIINLSTDQRHLIQGAEAQERLKIKVKDHVLGIPRDLFDIIVKKFRPVHVQAAHALLQLSLIVALIGVTISIVVVKPLGPVEGMSEVMHVIFIMVVGALPKIVEMLISTSDHLLQKEIQGRKLKAAILEYWANRMRQDD